MPAVPSPIIKPIRDQFAALLPTCTVALPLGCHRRRIPDRIVFDKLVQVLEDVAFDCCMTKAPCGSEVAGRSPVDRGTQGLKRSVAVDEVGTLMATIAAHANRHDSPLLEPTLAAWDFGGEPTTVHLDRGYGSKATRRWLVGRGLTAAIAAKGKPAAITAGKRWVVERTTAWTNAHKKLAWCTGRRAVVVAFWIAFSAVIIIVGRLVREA
jgi:hypothetical protein